MVSLPHTNTKCLELDNPIWTVNVVVLSKCWCKYNVQTKLRFPALPQALKTRDGLPLLEWPHGSDFKVLVNWESKVLQSCGTKASASKFSTVGVARVVCKLKQYRLEAFIELFFVII